MPESAPLVKERLDSVQALRGIAAVAVVAHHIPLFGNGAWGVDLFFVISGFIMCYVTERSSRNFFIKRVIRIVPLYWLGTIGVFCLAILLPRLLNSSSGNVVELLKSLCFIPFQKGDEIRPLLFLGWTLNYEVFFYVLFGLSLTITHRYRAVLTSGMLVLVVALGWCFPTDYVPIRFFTNPIILEFAFGMLAYLLYQRTAGLGTATPSAVWRWGWSLAGFLFLAGAPLVAMVDPRVQQPCWSRTWEEGLLATAAFYCLLTGLSGVRLPTLLVMVGDASYSLYLFHPYVLQVFDKLFHAFAKPTAAGYLLGLVAIALCCGLALLSYQFIEQPVTNYCRKRFMPREA